MGKVTFTIEADSVGEILDEIVRVAERLRMFGQNPVSVPGEPVTWVPVATAEVASKEEEPAPAPVQEKARKGRPPKSNGREAPEPVPLKAAPPQSKKDIEPRKEITYDDVSEIALRVFQHGDEGKSRVIELKNELGIGKFTELRPEHYDHAFNRLTQIADDLDAGAA